MTAETVPYQFRIQSLPEGWANAKVAVTHTDGRVEHRIEIIDTHTQLRYMNEPLLLISAKCVALFLLVLPSYFLFYTAFHLIRLPVVTLVNLSPTALLVQIWKIARIPIFLIGLECAALYGLLNPLEGRALFGIIESMLHDGKNLRHAERDLGISPKVVWENLSAKENKTSLFVGLCMQPIGKTTDPHIKFKILPAPE